MTAQGGAGVVCVEHASDRDAVAGISEHGWGGADGAACLSFVPFLRAIVSCPAELDGARAQWPFRRGRAGVRLDDGGR